jgi:uncharacterized phosphosugar-binding protein
MKAYEKYYERLIDNISKIKNTEGDAIERASDKIISAMENEKDIYFFGPGGHSSIFAEDVMYREGELSNIIPIIDPNISLGHGAMKEINYFERVKGLGEAIIKYNRLKKGDVIVIGSPYGINQVCIDSAQYSKNIGVYVIAITSPEFANNENLENERRHSSERSLSDIADITINSFTPIDDLTIYDERTNQKYGPMGTILQLITLKFLTTRTIEKIIEKGNIPEIWKDALERGGTEHNEKNLNSMFGKIRAL